MVGSALKKPAQTRVRNPITPKMAGQFDVFVSSAQKWKTRFFGVNTNPWSEKHGFPFELESKSTGGNPGIKFMKTRADVCVDEDAYGKPIVERWKIKDLIFYPSKNPIGPAAKTPKKPARRPMPITPNRGKNPAKKLPKTLYNGVSPFRYVVEKADTRTAKWSPLASFAGKSDAIAWANDYAKQNRTHPVRVFDREE